MGRVRDTLILGCGRSGTSLVAGLASTAGYFMGPDLHPPRDANPRGFFEGQVIKDINETLIETAMRGSAFVPDTERGSRWLEVLDPGVEIAPLQSTGDAIRGLTSRRPFAFKDPRFCYTLPAWRPWLPPGVVYVCVFREPGRTVNSILKECATAPWLSQLDMSATTAEALWSEMYRRIVDDYSGTGGWLFLHYEQLISGAGVAELARHLQAPISPSFVDPVLKRSADRPIGPAATRLYERLCELARYSP